MRISWLAVFVFAVTTGGCATATDDGEEDVGQTAASADALTVGCTLTATSPKFVTMYIYKDGRMQIDPNAYFEGTGTWSCPKRGDGLLYRQVWSLQSCGYGSCGDVASSVWIQPKVIGGSGTWWSHAYKVSHGSYYRSSICVSVVDEWGHVYDRGGCVTGPIALL